MRESSSPRTSSRFPTTIGVGTSRAMLCRVCDCRAATCAACCNPIGSNRFYFIGIGAVYPQGNDPLRIQQNCAVGNLAWPCRAYSRQRGYRQRCASRSHPLGGRGGHATIDGGPTGDLGRGGWFLVRERAQTNIAASAL